MTIPSDCCKDGELVKESKYRYRCEYNGHKLPKYFTDLNREALKHVSTTK